MTEKGATLGDAKRMAIPGTAAIEEQKHLDRTSARFFDHGGDNDSVSNNPNDRTDQDDLHLVRMCRVSREHAHPLRAAGTDRLPLQ